MLSPSPTMCHSFCRGDEGAIELSLALGRQRRQQAERMLKRIERSRQPGLRQPRGDDAGLRGAADLERLGHGAEIGDQSCRHRGGDGHGGGRTGSIEAAQFGAGRRCGDGAEHRTGMPALAVQRRRLARQQFGPHFEPCDIGRQHFGAARSARLALGEDRRHQHGARMAVEPDVVVVQHVGGHAIDERRAFDAAPRARGNERGERACVA